jgi:hypothetical protein
MFRTLTRRGLLGALAASTATPLLAHHGWRWTADGRFEVEGVIVAARLGNPHGVLTLDVEGESWTVEVGQPWRNARAGLSDDMLVPGVEITAIGRRSANPDERLMKAEEVVIGANTFVLYS